MNHRANPVSDALPAGSIDTDRLVDRYVGVEPGPCLLCVGGMHGNEPAGVAALRRVFDKLRQMQPPFRGEFIGLIGNVGARAVHQRFVDRDLNRMWSPNRVHAVRRSPRQNTDSHEDEEQRGLLNALHAVIDPAPRRVFFLDLHTTSAPSAPFVIIGDTLANRGFAFHFPVTIVLGLEERLAGTIPEYVNSLGAVTMGAEGGPHDDPQSVDRLEAVLWLAIEAIALVHHRHLPDFDSSRRLLEQASEGRPRIIEITDGHHVREGDGFVMEAGFRSFSRVRRGQILARDNSGDIRARRNGILLLPLYQSTGSDGYFVARPVRRFWLGVSTILRRMRLDRIVHWLPGVKRHPTLPDSLIVNRHVARWLVRQVFHLLGFRQRRHDDETVVFTRREHDAG